MTASVIHTGRTRPSTAGDQQHPSCRRSKTMNRASRVCASGEGPDNEAALPSVGLRPSTTVRLKLGSF